MAQKVIKIGKSIGVTIPREILRELGIKAGDEIVIEADKRRGGFLARTTRKKVEIDKEFLDWTDAFIEEYRPALKALSEK